MGEAELEHVEEAELEVVEQVEVLQELNGGIIEQYLGEVVDQATMSQLDSSNDSLFMLPLVGNVEEYFTIAEYFAAGPGQEAPAAAVEVPPAISIAFSLYYRAEVSRG